MNKPAFAQRPMVMPHSEEGRLQLTSLVMRLFQKWEIDTKTQLNLLGMKESSRAILTHYRTGTRAVPDDTDKLNRVGLLLLIHKSLRLLFPENANLVYSWIKCRNKIFENHAPLDLIREHGLFGLAQVARYLESELVK